MEWASVATRKLSIVGTHLAPSPTFQVCMLEPSELDRLPQRIRIGGKQHGYEYSLDRGCTYLRYVCSRASDWSGGNPKVHLTLAYEADEGAWYAFDFDGMNHMPIFKSFALILDVGWHEWHVSESRDLMRPDWSPLASFKTCVL